MQGAHAREELLCPAAAGGRGGNSPELSHPSLVVQEENLVESMAMRGFKADRANGCLKLLAGKNFGEYLIQSVWLFSNISLNEQLF